MTAAKRKGLQRSAFDLHVHTPASHDWRGEAVSPQQLVERAIELGLNGLAITDHATGAWVDRVKAAAVGTELVIVPGVELNNLAGNEGIHLIALFDTEVTSSDVDRFLTTIGALRGAGERIERGSATSGPLEVLTEIENFGGIAVLAHCRSPKGALGGMRGDLRTRLVQHPALLAVEAPAENYFDQKKREERKRVYDILDGTDATYQRELAVYQASDNPASQGYGHGLAGLGSRFTYFWVERPVTLESLRQCFVDRSVRIEYPLVGDAVEPDFPLTAPTITRIHVTGGFLDELDLEFHGGLTTILGPKGSGKSIIIELLRFALDQEPTQPEIRKDHETKLAKQLGLYGRVAVDIRLADGTTHAVEREFNPAAGNPFRPEGLSPADLLPCHFLSQGEIVRIAESEDEQIRFIDSFFDFRTHQRGIDEVRAQLRELDTEVARQIRARKTKDDLKLRQKVLQEEIAAKDAGLKSPVFAKFQQAQAKAQALQRGTTAISGLSVALANARHGLETVPDPPIAPDEVASDPAVRRLNDLAARAKKEALQRLAEAVDGVALVLADANIEQTAWAPVYEAIADEYSKEVQKSGGDVRALSQARTKLLNDLSTLEDKLNAADQLAGLLRPTVDRRNDLLGELRLRQTAYTDTRKERCDWFVAKSNGQIEARVSAASNRDDFRERLSSMKRGSYLSAPEIDAIAGAATPDDFVRALLRFDLTGHENELDAIASASKLPVAKIAALATFLLGEGADGGYESLLELQYAVTPTDRPEISFRRDDGTFAPIAELSTGQKCTALLIMALCEGDAPIIVDQPEDSLDIRSIWEDMCLRLRVSKRTRQFAFTTHNSSLAVASDSDKFVVLAADARHAVVVLDGAIDHEDVRQEVIKLLEGGTSTYFLKQRKYNVRDRFGH